MEEPGVVEEDGPRLVADSPTTHQASPTTLWELQGDHRQHLAPAALVCYGRLVLRGRQWRHHQGPAWTLRPTAVDHHPQRHQEAALVPSGGQAGPVPALTPLRWK